MSSLVVSIVLGYPSSVIRLIKLAPSRGRRSKCRQYASNGNAEVIQCLSVNVIRPAGISTTAKLPVVLWIYGGASEHQNKLR